MPQYQQQKKGQARVRVLSKDATRAYLFLMKQSGGKIQVLPNDVYVIDENLVTMLKETGIEYEVIEQK